MRGFMKGLWQGRLTRRVEDWIKRHEALRQKEKAIHSSGAAFSGDRRLKLREDVEQIKEAAAISFLLIRQRGRRRALRATFFMLMAFASAAGYWWYTNTQEPVQVHDAWKTIELSKDGKGTARVPIIQLREEIDGDIHAEQGPQNTVRYIADALTRAKEESNLAFVVLYIQNYGGTVYAAGAVHELIMKFRNETKKPVYVYVPGNIYSAAYWIATAGDSITAHPLAEVGNIGVRKTSIYKCRMGKRIGVDDETISTGPEKTSGSEWQCPNPYEQKTEQHIVDTLFDQFLLAVAEGRKIPFAQLKREARLPGSRTSGASFVAGAVEDGKVVRGDAYRLGLIDDVLSYDAFLQKHAEELANNEEVHYRDVKFIVYDQRKVDNTPKEKSPTFHLFDFPFTP